MATKLIHEVEDDEQQAEAILAAADRTPSTYPDALLEILTDIIKPLFSSSNHPQLTATGRKRLISTPSIPGTFKNDSIFDDSRPWKNGWTPALLLDILSRRYYKVPESLCKKTIEAHFHLLVPPILNIIDDTDLNYKAEGCRCLTAFCQLLTSIESDMMKRTGLMDVFVDTLKNNFIHLPPLTPETGSLNLLRSLYPAFFALVATRFQLLAKANPQYHKTITTKITTAQPPTQLPSQSEQTLRQTYLTLLLRHSLLYSLTSLSPSSSFSTSPSPAITHHLISQLSPLITAMGPTSTPRHIPQLLPLLRAIMSDPFAGASPDLLLSAIEAMRRILLVCGNRNGEMVVRRWWPECLRGVVACWLNVLDDQSLIKEVESIVKDELERVKIALREVVPLLRNSGNEIDFGRARELMVAEETGLRGLFEPV